MSAKRRAPQKAAAPAAAPAPSPVFARPGMSPREIVAAVRALPGVAVTSVGMRDAGQFWVGFFAGWLATMCAWNLAVRRR